MVAADFEKDDDSNGHIDFIAAAAVSTHSSLSLLPSSFSHLLSILLSMKWNMFWGYVDGKCPDQSAICSPIRIFTHH